MDTKKSLIFLGIVAAVAIASYGIYRGTHAPAAPGNASAEEALSPCAVSAEALTLDKPEGGFADDEAAVRAIFDHYFAQYEKMSACPALSLKGYRLSSVEDIQRPEEGRLTARIVFDLMPEALEGTGWAAPDSTIEDGWIVGKKGMLSIMERSDYYYLVI